MVKSKYQLSARKGKKKQCKNGKGSKVWLRTRHRVRTKLLR